MEPSKSVESKSGDSTTAPQSTGAVSRGSAADKFQIHTEPPGGRSVELHRWTLRFLDATMEADFVRFRTRGRVWVIIVLIALFAALALVQALLNNDTVMRLTLLVPVRLCWVHLADLPRRPRHAGVAVRGGRRREAV
jgi:hypothetical protein